MFSSSRIHPVRYYSMCLAVVLVLGLLPSPSAAVNTYTVLVNFMGQLPQEPAGGPSAVQGRDGNFYGVTLLGGANGLGTVYKVTPSGTLTTLYSFDGTIGQYPGGGLTLGTDGNLYGVANRGASAGFGCIFKITTAGVISNLHTFTNTGDGTNPAVPPIQGADGNFYGTTTGMDVSTFEANSTVYKLTPAGVYTVIKTLDPATQGNNVDFLAQGTDGNFYGTAGLGGSAGQGTIFKLTASGNLTVLHNFSGPNGEQGVWMTLGSDGAFYGITFEGGTAGAGEIFKITTAGAYTVLHDLNGATDGSNPLGSITLGSDGNFYGVTLTAGASIGGTIFRFTKTGAYTKLWDFNCNSATQFGCNPQTGIIQSTNGIFYGATLNAQGGVFYSWNEALQPFIELQTTSGRVGNKVNILGQGFSAASVVRFNGVQATTVTRSGTTFLTATVPTGASSGKVTVTTGGTTLTSTQSFTVHNSWGSAAPMPTARAGGAIGVIGGKVYVVSGETNTAIVANNEIYNPTTNTWTTGALIPTPIYAAASAVVNNVLYVMGGLIDSSQTPQSIVQAYNPTTNTWSTKSPMPVATDSMNAVVEDNLIYAVGGYANGSRSALVQVYNPVTDTWTMASPLVVAKSESVLGVLGGALVSSGGLPNGSNPTGDTESYSTSTNTWSTLAPDATTRNSACGAALLGQLYVTGGSTSGFSGNVTTITESFNPTKNAWTTLAPVPLGVTGALPAVINNQLYCFGGTDDGSLFGGNIYNNVQIYQP